MYPVSNLFLASLRGPHRIATLIEVSDSHLGPWTTLSYETASGEVQVNRNGAARRQLSLSITGVLDPAAAVAGELSPHTGFIRPWRGVTYPGQGTELAPLGVFRIHDAEFQRGTAGKISGYSLDQDLADNRFAYPYIEPTPKTIRQHMESIVGGTLPGLTLTWDAALWNPTLGAITFERDRRKALDDLAAAAGGEISAAQTGEIVVKPAGTVSQTPVWDVDAGETGVLIDYAKKFSRTGVYNGVLVSNENPNSAAGDGTPVPIVVLVYDTDPLSPTYWFGSFGHKTRFFTSIFIATRSQAVAAGQSILAKEKGLSTSLDFTFVPNPALDVDDVVLVAMGDGTVEPALIDSLTIGLGSDTSMRGATRTIQAPQE